jgi:hypothetical protein
MALTKERKILTAIITVMAVVTGAVGWAAVDAAVTWGDIRYVTVAAQNKALRFEMEDELNWINERIANGTATTQDVKRKAVLEDRLRRL